jgi:hypothetical protein
MYDLKESLVVNSKKLHKSLKSNLKLGKLDSMEEYHRSEAEWKDFFTYDAKRTAIENFLIYRIGCAYQIYEINDADMTPAALNYLREKLEKIDTVDKVRVGVCKPRAFEVELKNGKVIYLESDTANSFNGVMGIFFRNMIPQIFHVSSRNWPAETYIPKYGLFEKKDNNYLNPYKFFYFLEILPELREKLSPGPEQDCLKELEKRAAITHTLPNMMLTLYNYNSARGFGLETYQSQIRINDRLDYTYRDICEMYEDSGCDSKCMKERLDRLNQKQGKRIDPNNIKFNRESLEFLHDNMDALMPPCPQADVGNETDIDAVYKRCKAVTNTF